MTKNIGVCAATALFATALCAAEVVVKPGDDIGAALAKLREGRKPGERCELVLADGVHRVMKTIKLGKDDGGIVIRSKNPGKATVAGGWIFKGSDMKPAASSWVGSLFSETDLERRIQKEVRGKCLAIDIPAEVYSNRFAGLSRLFHGGIQKRIPILTVDGEYQPISHWPNGRERWWLTKEALCGTVEREVVIYEKPRKVQNPYFKVERAKGWDLADSEAFLFGCLSGWGYEAGSAGVFASTNGADVVEVNRLSPQSVNTYTRFVFFNLLEEIDEPGEWAFDAKTKKLVLYPDAGFTDGSTCAVGTFDSPFISLKGASDVRIEGIVFTAKCGEHCIVIENGSGNVVAGCRFSGVRQGVSVSGLRNKVVSCDFENLLDNGVTLAGGEVKSMARGGNVVENCLFSEFGILSGGYADAVIVNGCGNAVRHCEMHGAIGHAMDIRGPENLVEYCRIYDVCRDHDDSGALYANGVWSYGTIIRYNDIGTSVGLSSGIYLDDFCCGTTVYGNILRNVGHFGVFISGGRDITVENNIFTGCWGGIRLDNRGLFWDAWKDREKFWNDVSRHFGLAEGTAFAKAHPRLADWMNKDGTNMITGPVDNEYRNNLYLDIPGYSTSFLVCLGRDIPDSRITAEGNMYVRTKGLAPGANDFATGDSSKIPDNKHTGKSYYVRSLDRNVKVLDGTAQEPVDLGFVRVAKPSFDVSDYYWEQQGWVDEDKLRAKREKGYEQTPFDVGDYSLAAGARLLKEMPNFKPIPFAEIGLYKDEYRTTIP